MHVIDKAVGTAMALFAGWMDRLDQRYPRYQERSQERYQGLRREERGPSRRRFVSWRPATGRTRADVPGWVLITLMSAVLVAGLLAIAGPALQGLFNQAMEQVQP